MHALLRLVDSAVVHAVHASVEYVQCSLTTLPMAGGVALDLAAYAACLPRRVNCASSLHAGSQ